MAASVAKTIPQSNDNIMSLQGFQYQSNILFNKDDGLLTQAQAVLSRNKNYLDKEIKQLKAHEKELLRILGKSSIEELNSSIKEYESAVVNLSGSSLRQAFLKGMEGVKIIDADVLMNFLLQEIEKEQEELIDKKAVKETEMLEVLNLFRRMRFGSRGSFTASIEVKSGSQNFPKNYIELSTLSQAQKKFLNNLAKKEPTLKKAIQVITPSIEQNQDYTEMSFSWGATTELLTQSEAKLFFKDNQSELHRINQIIVQEIINKCNNAPLIKKILNHILHSDPYAFFVGNNEKDITGLLGEIKGMYYLGSILGEDNISKMKWAGGLHVGKDGQKPHRDIILEGMGIQVKNTAADTNYLPTSFSDANIDTFLLNINKEASLGNANVRELVTQYYGLRTFNVPYHIGRGGKAYEKLGNNSKNKTYASLVNQLRDSNDIITRALAIFSASMMYINTDEIFSDTSDRNVLYFVAGKSFVLASEILTDIKQQIESQTHPRSFAVRATNSDNIISAYNRGETQYTVGTSAANVNLTSSYTFKIPK